MRVSLTRDFVKKIPIPKRPIDYRDTRLKGLILRAMPSGVKSWYCEYARAKRVWLGRVDAVGYSEAFEAAQTILSESYRGIDPIEARKPKTELPQLIDFLDGDYRGWARANQRAHEKNLARLKTAFKSLLQKKLDESPASILSAGARNKSSVDSVTRQSTVTSRRSKPASTEQLIGKSWSGTLWPRSRRSGPTIA